MTIYFEKVLYQKLRRNIKFLQDFLSSRHFTKNSNLSSLQLPSKRTDNKLWSFKLKSKGGTSYDYFCEFVYIMLHCRSGRDPV